MLCLAIVSSDIALPPFKFKEKPTVKYLPFVVGMDGYESFAEAQKQAKTKSLPPAEFTAGHGYPDGRRITIEMYVDLSVNVMVERWDNGVCLHPCRKGEKPGDSQAMWKKATPYTESQMQAKLKSSRGW